MRLKLIVLSTLAMLAGAASAAPSLQSCSAMEITHSGTGGMSYTMSCLAGGWQLRYTGAVPAGNKPLDVQYQLAVTGADGAAFTQNRTVRLPSPASLGQVLVREAALLDNGDLALRECKDIGCTLYRPLGSAQGLAKATVTVTPELARLREEQRKLSAELDTRTQALALQEQSAKQLAAELASAQARLSAALERNAAQAADHSAQLQAVEVAHRATLAEVEHEYGLLAAQTLKLSTDLLAQEAGHQLAARECALSAVQPAPAAAPAPAAPDNAALFKAEVAQLSAALAEKTRRGDELAAEVTQLKGQLARLLDSAKPMTHQEREATDSTIARLRAEKVWLQDDVERLQAELAALRAPTSPQVPTAPKP